MPNISDPKTAEQEGRRAYQRAIGSSIGRCDRNTVLLHNATTNGQPLSAQETRRFYFLCLLDLSDTVSTPRMRQAIAYAQRRIAEDRDGANPTTNQPTE